VVLGRDLNVYDNGSTSSRVKGLSCVDCFEELWIKRVWFVILSCVRTGVKRLGKIAQHRDLSPETVSSVNRVPSNMCSFLLSRVKSVHLTPF